MATDKAPAAHADVIAEMAGTCMMMRTRLVARVITGIYDQALRAFGLNSPQLALLVVIRTIGPATRADIGRYHHQERSTLTRNLQIMLSSGWIEEVRAASSARGRPIALTKGGIKLLHDVTPAWRVAQAQAKVVLGEAGAIEISNVADELTESTQQG
jgi:DNA-binding MarR family transcriptional regulator